MQRQAITCTWTTGDNWAGRNKLKTLASIYMYYKMSAIFVQASIVVRVSTIKAFIIFTKHLLYFAINEIYWSWKKIAFRLKQSYMWFVISHHMVAKLELYEFGKQIWTASMVIGVPSVGLWRSLFGAAEPLTIHNELPKSVLLGYTLNQDVFVV